MGVSELCQRIVCDLEALLRKHALLESFDVVIKENSAERSNRSPVYVVENHLGLESWCVTPVYTFASQQLLGCYDTEKLIQLTNVLLLLNPELAVAWNHRKLLYLQRKLSLQQELQLSQLALSRKPKTAEAFSHRKWLLGQEMENYPLERRQAVLHSELQLCDTMATKYFSNYHAWDYRRHLVREYVEGAPLIIESELQRSKDFLQSHVSDHSGMSYRQYVLLRVNSRPLFQAELQFITDLIHTFPGHEALWQHRRFCVLACLGLLKSADKRLRSVSKDHKDPTRVNRATQDEQVFVRDVLCTGEQWQRTLCERHIRWMRNTLHIELDANQPKLANGVPFDVRADSLQMQHQVQQQQPSKQTQTLRHDDDGDRDDNKVD
ncbi:protein prenyltransferase alpha subunit repeat-containing protein 1-like [Varroa jacobsoni]|uniref:protein prenyltransferase alpha subunit repeat-containing protein 1-like n=1 Tax=Varroa jacobsoni TaxID=62625 RepID=UPI000BF2755B|nr:protein prenyltransferase alpha subunit repeat-containing protein 1-like [Varroa jacobsoni]XP_022693360.1 protein prenyltransferase alpha subunit repeat-containing protein 1-like [Varroa jacobsoni]XP_022693361.1 protein prenyltransferase alpha subunit repeat-containing protein 1-like [Varroa jacobsoni]